MERNNTVKQFLSKTFGEVRVVLKGEDLWFVAKDICDILGTKTKDIPTVLKNKGIDSIDILTNGGKQNMTIINEQSLYKLIFKSRKPFAEEFQDWICGEVIPSIRKNDGYIDKQEELSPEELMAKALLVAQQVIDEKERKIKEQEVVIVEQGTVIDILSNEHTTIHGSREKVNMIIRKIAAKEYNNLFGKCWKEFYSVLRYEHHIGNKIKDMTEDQLVIAYKTALSWANKLNIEAKETLN